MAVAPLLCSRPPHRLVATATALLLLACAQAPSPSPPAPPPPRVVERVVEVEVYRRAESDRADQLAREVERLRADLRAAEQSLVAAESGLRGRHSRADAISALAEARIEVERAAEVAPWRASEVAEARGKLEDGEQQITDENHGAALFFSQRALRIAQMVQLEAHEVGAQDDARFVRAASLNLRSGPSTGEKIIGVLSQGTPVFPEVESGSWVLVRTVSGRAGWVNAKLLRDTAAPASRVGR